MNLRRFDTLFVRLFLLMWVTLVLSHLLAFSLAVPERPSFGGGPGGPAGVSDRPPPPAMPSLPPPSLPGSALWRDYALRIAVIALGAALGARWLSAPMRRLSKAADGLSHGLAATQALPQLDETRGTAEVRAAARVFNTMARRLQEQFDARGMHMAALSHDLRTPLTRLRMRLEDTPAELADAAAADIHEMSEMMDSTLAVLREQREGTAPGPLNVFSLLEALVDDHAVAGHLVQLNAPQDQRLLARARPAALRRVLDNLVGNALRYGGSAELGLSAIAGGVEITVDDRGPGIPAEQLALAFKPWVRLNDTPAHARAGHGLGLAIASDLAERDGGTLTLANRAGGGLRAVLYLPAAPAFVSAPTRGA